MWSSMVFDICSGVFAVTSVAAYQIYRWYKQRTVGNRNTLSLGRREWVKCIMQDNPGRAVLAVQTLRNCIMGSTLMATSAILVTTGMAAIISSSYQIKMPLTRTIFSENDIFVTFKFGVLCACFLICFLLYIQSIKLYNHVNVLINIPLHRAQDIGWSPERVADVLDTASSLYSSGTRIFYLGFVLLTWVFHPIPVFGGAILLIVCFSYSDQEEHASAARVGNREETPNGSMQL